MGFPAASAGPEPRNRTQIRHTGPSHRRNRYPPIGCADSWTMGPGLRRDDGW